MLSARRELSSAASVAGTATEALSSLYRHAQCVALDTSDEAHRTAALVEELSTEIRRVLTAHPINRERLATGKTPANVVLLRGCGCRIKAPPFREVHGMRAFMVAPTKCILGIGMSCGVDPVVVAGATGDYATQLACKAEVRDEAPILSPRLLSEASVPVCHLADTAGSCRTPWGRGPRYGFLSHQGGG